jgi:hypothetical protein
LDINRFCKNGFFIHGDSLNLQSVGYLLPQP